MIESIARRPMVAVLGAMLVLLLVLVGVEAGMGSRTAHDGGPVKAAATPEAKLLPPVVAQAPDQAYPEMAARPLFTPTRRPAPAEPNQGKPAFARGQFVLQGVIVVGDQRTALLREKTSGKVHRVDRGKELEGGIKVESVEPTEVTLTMGGEREKVALVVQRPDAATRGAPTHSEPAQGPFGAVTTPAPAAARSEPASAPATTAAHPAPASPVTRIPRQPGASANPPATTQPMTAEELLARRRARRNQPTQ
jgi:general secretion pathway protein N